MRDLSQQKFRVGQKVRFTQDALEVEGWWRKPNGYRVTTATLSVLGYEIPKGGSWDTVHLSDGTTYSERWLESAEDEQ